ncbi:NAD(P)-dependent alcohol dehydrogenase [Microbacterium sp. Se63.02b]|uniref:NAD(P)-dependent alcohol dehydrogenase n=1 Tax=Microbacterium sp. Se63.02b TaxID=2709304 RepID=UPI001FCE6780|nr:NAD(P)-dependent alcohol dehydrogenase [Microbacterium sp. Se63.02b]
MKRTELPTTMRASVLVRAGELTVETRPVPVPLPDQVIVRVNAVGICGSDVHYFHEGRIGDFVVEEPLVLGHESGSDRRGRRRRRRLPRGERVSIEPQRPCRVCEFCRSGRYNLCPRIEFYATPPIDGAFAEYVAISNDFAYTVPDAVSDDAAALMEPLSVAIAAIQKAGVRPGSRVLITGAGPIGIVTAQTARAFGAAAIVISDPMAERREVALRFGATEAVDPASGPLGTGYDAFIDASGSPVAVKQGISALKPGGVAVLVGMGADEIALPVSTIQNRELVVTGIFRYANTWPTAIQLVASGAVDLDALVTGSFGIREVREALDSASHPSTLKSIVRPDREYARES